jgi:hypothetical protein
MSDFEETRATARLFNVDVELLHRRPWTGDAEMIAVTVRPVPSIEAFGRLLEATNPFLFWARWLESLNPLAWWAPWLPAPSSPPLADDRATD